MSQAIGSMAFVFLLYAALRAYYKDRRGCDRCIIVLTIISQLAVIAFHALYDPITTMTAAICIEGYLALQVYKSNFPQKSAYVGVLFASITLSFLWGLDFYLGTGLLYVGDEPSVYTFLVAVFTLLQGVIFLGTPNGRRINSDADRRFYNRNLATDKGGD